MTYSCWYRPHVITIYLYSVTIVNERENNVLDEKKFRVISKQETADLTFEVIELDSLGGSDDLDVANKVFLANQANIHIKMIRITLRNSTVIIEPGALFFMKGQLTLESNAQGGLAKGLMRKFLSGETLFQSTIKGTGEVYLEPSFGNYLLFDLENDSLVFDKGTFCCGSSKIEIAAKLQKNISSAVFGGEGLFQTEAKGSGIVVLNCPVPENELFVYELVAGEKLSIDGNFSLARTGSVSFAAEKSAKSLFKSVTSGEGLLQTFTGPGIVWIAPTKPVYDNIRVFTANSQISEAKNAMGNKS